MENRDIVCIFRYMKRVKIRRTKIKIANFLRRERVQDTIVFVAMMITVYYFIKASV